MKKKLLLSMLAFFCLVGGSAWAQTFTQGNLKYNVTGSNTVSVAKDGDHQLSGALTIPSSVTYDGTTYTVTTIPGYAFEGQTMTAVSIPGTVTSLGDRAFGDCHSLAKITFEESDEPLSLRVGYYGSFQYCDHDKEVIVNRNLTPSENGCPIYEVTSVVIGGKATTVANSLFYGQRKMTSISIGNSVTSIGNAAFYGCGSESDEVEMTLTLSDNITTIGENAFFSCPALKSLTLPSSLKLIGGDAFSGASIASLVIPESVDSIGQHAFENCKKLTSIRIEDSDKPLKMVEGYYRPFHYCDAPKSVYLGRNLILSENSTPFETAITSIEIGDKVTTINPRMFADNNLLTSVTIGKGVKSIEYSAFYNCGNDESVNELTVSLGKNTTKICEDAFHYCTKLKSVTLPSSLKLIEGNAFSNTGLTNITIPASVDSLGLRTFGECGNLTNIRIEDNATPLKMWNGYYGTFAYSDAEKTVYVGRDMELNEEATVFGANPTSVTFGDNVTTINPRMFSDNGKLASVTIGKGVKTIGYEAFRNSGNDESVNELTVSLGKNTTKICEDAFHYCTKLKSVTLPSSLKLIEGNAFSNTGLTSITIPASVDSLGLRTFGECGNLTSIRIEDNATPLKMWNGYYGTFAYSDAEKTVYVGRDMELNEEATVFGANPTSVTFGDNVTTINPRMFSDNGKLASVTIGNGVKTIGNNAFYNCGNDDSVNELTVSMGTGVETIGNNAFDLCRNMKAITLPATLTTIGETTFASTGLTTISIPASVTSIGAQAFGWNSITKIIFEDGDQPLAMVNGYYRTFRDQGADFSLYLGRNLQYDDQGDSPFYNATSVTIGSKVTSLKPNELRSDKLQSVKVPWQTPIAIEQNVFSDYTYQNGLLFVPGGTMPAYADDAVWSKFLNVEASSYFVTGTATAGGTLKFAGMTVTNDTKKLLVDRETDVVFEVAPEANYDFASLTVNGEAVNVENNTYTYPQLLTDISVKAIFTEKPKFDIKATATGGTVSLNDAQPSASQTIKVYRDTDVTLAIAAAEGYENPKVTVNGQDVTAQLRNNKLTLRNIQEAKTIVVTYAKKTFRIVAANVQNGSIQLSQTTVEWGGSFTATFKPATGYEFATASVNGVDVTAQVQNNVLTVTDVKEAKTVSATFKKLTFEIAKQTTQNGTITLSQTTVEWGDSFKATFTPATGYELATATVNGVDFTANVVNNVLTVTNVQENKTVGATFQKQTYSVSISGAGISVSTTAPKYGDNVTVTIDNDPDRTLVSLLVNGQDVTAQVVNGQYIIRNITGNVTIEATFRSTKEFITMTDEYAVFSCPQDLDFSESNLCAYIVSGVNKNTHQVLMTRVFDVPAGTGLYLIGTPGQTYKIPYSESYSIYKNFLVANLTKSSVSATTGSYTNYAFGTEDGDPGFYPISGSTTLLAQTAYLQLPTSFVEAGVKMSIILEEDLIDGIEDFRISDSEETIYDLAGRRLSKTQKGINIVHGKKILK